MASGYLGEGGGDAHPLHPPPRSAPGKPLLICEILLKGTKTNMAADKHASILFPITNPYPLTEISARNDPREK